MSGWPDRWTAFARELAAPLAPRVLARENWSLADWVDRLIAAHDEPEPRPARPEPSGKTNPDEVYTGPYARQIKNIRDHSRDNFSGVVRTAVLDKLREEQTTEARSAFHNALACTLLIVLIPAAIIFITMKGLL